MNTEFFRLDGPKVTRLRRAKGWGPSKLVEVIKEKGGELSVDTLREVEKGFRKKDKRPTQVVSTTLDTLAWAFGVDRDELIIGEGDNVEAPEIPEGVKDSLCSFDAFIDDRTDGFVGREFVFEAINQFQGNVSSGYFVIRGEPGIGKSALCARLVQMEDCVHHFNIALQGINTTGIFLRNVCAQLITRFQLPYSSLPDEATQSGVFLNKVIRESQKNLKTGEKLLISIDALDEVNLAGHPPSANVLFLPPSLPESVYVVVTMRPLQDLPFQVSRQRTPPLDLGRNSDGQIADVRLYIQSYLANEEVRRWYDGQKLSEKGFVDMMFEKSECNFMYLRYILSDISAGAFKGFGIESLPNSLTDYYRGHWTIMKHRNPTLFEELYEPVVCVLAAEKEAVTADEVADVTDIDVRKVRDVIRVWRQYLYEEADEKGSLCYRLYHASFQEFLQEEVDPGLRTYHKLIGQTVLKKAGLLDKGPGPTVDPGDESQNG